jgi:TonB-linked SusC/RagA family outer membrane protein
MKNVLLNPCGESSTNKMGRLGALASWSTQTFRMLALVGIFCLAAFTNASAQQVTIRGTVKDATGAGLPGVGVRVKDANTTTSTDVNGAYSISAPATGTIVFSFVGYANQEVSVAGKTTLDVTLAEATQNLDEVVVTALGVTKSRRSLVSSVQEVKGEEFTGARENNIANALTGKIAGLDAAQVNSGPGSSSKVTIRGANSLQRDGNNQPLYVVDGVPISNNRNVAATGSQSFNVDRGDGISMINPDDIESISVLKGGSAAALYGSQAANGVILVTTKSGKANKGVGVDINSVGTMRTPSIYPNYQYQYGQGGAPNAGAWTVPTTLALAQASGRLSFGPKMDPSISYIQVDGQQHPLVPQNVKDNIKNFYNTANDLTNSVAFSGGNENFTTRVSVTDLRSNAQQPNSTYTRQGGVVNTSAKLGKNNWLTVAGGLNYSSVKGKNRPNVGYAEYSADWPVYLIANTVDIRSLSPGVTSTGNELAWNLAQEAPNPYYVVNYMANADRQQRMIFNADIKMNIVRNLSVRVWGNRDYQLRFL